VVGISAHIPHPSISTSSFFRLAVLQTDCVIVIFQMIGSTGCLSTSAVIPI
jgi:hypothetical protein